MHRTRLARIAAAAVVSALVFAGLGTVPASAATPAPGTITGHVQPLVPGTPPTNFSVSAYSLAGKLIATSGTFGATIGDFTMSVPAGSYRLQYDFTNNTGAGGNWQTPFWSGATSLAGAPVVAVAAGQTLDVGAVQVPGGGLIAGTVHPAQYIPFGATTHHLTLYRADGTVVATSTVTETAAFSFKGLRPGEYVLGDTLTDTNYLPSFWPSAATFADAERITLDVAEQRTGIDFTPRRNAAIRGIVTKLQPDGSTVPVSGVNVFAIDSTTGVSRSVSTKADGSYALLRTPGTYRISFAAVDGTLPEYWSDSRDAAGATLVTLGTDDIAGYDAVLEPAAIIKGTATGPAEGRVEAYRHATDGSWEKVATSGVIAGAFKFGSLPDGDYVLKYYDTGTDPDFATTYNNAASFDEATPITVVARDVVSDVHLVSERVPFVPYARDWTGDGIPDLLVHNTKTQKISVYAGDGHGGISYSGTWANVAPNYLTFLQLGDFTRGGTPDLAEYWEGVGVTLHPDHSNLQIYYGTRIVQTLSRYTARIGPGDWNGDGQADILVRGSNGYLFMFPGHGDGTVGASVKIGTGWNSYALLSSVGDLSGDGKPDIVARDTVGRMWLYRGNGTGGFDGRVLLASHWQTMTAAFGVGDLSGDGKDDLVVRDAAGALWLYRGDDAGHLGTRTKLSGSWKGLRFVS